MVKERIEMGLLRNREFERNVLGWGLNLSYYLCLVISLSIFIYRHTQRRVFFWTWVGYAILLFFTLIIGVLFLHGGNGFYWLYWMYLLVFILLSLSLFVKRKSDMLSLISLNYFTYAIPSLFLMYNAIDGHRAYITESFETNFRLYTFSGFLLLLILLLVLIGPLYKRAYSLPSQ